MKSSSPKSSPNPTALSKPIKLIINSKSSRPSIVWSKAIISSSLNGWPLSFNGSVTTATGDSDKPSFALNII